MIGIKNKESTIDSTSLHQNIGSESKWLEKCEKIERLRVFYHMIRCIILIMPSGVIGTQSGYGGLLISSTGNGHHCSITKIAATAMAKYLQSDQRSSTDI
jgi:hypothetical protein